MSSALNPAAVTRTLRDWLFGVCHAIDSGSDVSMVRPDKISTAKPTVNLFLYQIEHNPGYAGGDLGTRRSDGSLAKRPTTAINLSYLVSFAASSEIASNNLMGAVVLAIHAHPGLTRSQIAASIAADPLLDGATLATQTEAIKLSMPQISLDELSKIWGMVTGAQFWLSIHVLATTVILESDSDPEAALPVRGFSAAALPSFGPSIDSIWSKGHRVSDPIETGATLVLKGANLLQPGTNILNAGLTLTLDSGETIVPTKSADVPDAIEAILPSSVPAGLRQLGAQFTSSGHTVTSGIFPFLLRPILASATVLPGNNVQLVFTPSISADQAAFAVFSLLSGDFADQHRIELPSAGRPYLTATVDCSGFPAGDYIVRLRVDGAESLLQFQSVAPKVQPVVTL
ncbi:MAG: DUF4255 domain-containing protein [Fimbriimonas sp.]|nr:DUF4255 domain-containing protein [Fimbriimonas sp.]